MSKNNQQCGAAVLFFLSAVVPLLLLAALLALDLDSDRIKYKNAVGEADRGALDSVLGSLNRYFNTIASNSTHWPLAAHAVVAYLPQSPFINVMRSSDKGERGLMVSSTARVVPVTISIVVQTQGMSSKELGVLRGEVLAIWDRFELTPEIPFELATVHSENVLRLTSRAYRSNLSAASKAEKRILLLAQEFSEPISTFLKEDAVWRIIHRLIFTVPHEQHTRHLVIYISKDDPLQLLVSKPFEMLQKSALCSDNALEYDVVNIQLTSTKLSKLWYDKTLCPRARVAVIGIDAATVTSTIITNAVATILRSVSKVEVER